MGFLTVFIYFGQKIEHQNVKKELVLTDIGLYIVNFGFYVKSAGPCNITPNIQSVNTYTRTNTNTNANNIGSLAPLGNNVDDLKDLHNSAWACIIVSQPHTHKGATPHFQTPGRLLPVQPTP